MAPSGNGVPFAPSFPCSLRPSFARSPSHCSAYSTAPLFPCSPSRSVQPKARLHLLREHARLRVVPDDAKHEADEGVQGQMPKGAVGVRRGVHHASGRKRRLGAGQVRVDRGIWGELPAAKMMNPFDGGLRAAGNTYTHSCGALPYYYRGIWCAKASRTFPRWFSCRNTLYINKHHTLAVTFLPIASLFPSNIRR